MIILFFGGRKRIQGDGKLSISNVIVYSISKLL